MFIVLFDTSFLQFDSQVQKELPAFLVGTGDEATGGTITKVPKCDGTASVACVRAKMRFFFELNIDVNYSIGPLADGSTMASGTLSCVPVLPLCCAVAHRLGCLCFAFTHHEARLFLLPSTGTRR